MTNTRCRIGTVFSPYDGHIVPRNMYRKAINILRKFVHQLVLFTRIYKDARSTKHKIPCNLWNSKVHYRIHISPPVIIVLSHIRSVNVLPSYSIRITFNAVRCVRKGLRHFLLSVWLSA